MAKVKITGHASGTGILTVTAPNTSTDRTITLPDATGTLLNSDGDGSNLTNLPSATADGFFASSGLSAKDLGDGLHIKTGDSGLGSVNSNFDQLIVENDTTAGISILTGTSNEGVLAFSDSGGHRGLVRYAHATDKMRFATGDVDRMNIDSSGNVGIGTANPGNYEGESDNLVIYSSGHTGLSVISGTSSRGVLAFGDGTGGNDVATGAIKYDHNGNYMSFTTGNGERMRITSDGRGLSQFTAKGWVQWDGTTIADSHNVSSVANPSTGKYTVNWDVDMADGDYAIGGMGHYDRPLAFENQPTTADMDILSHSTSGSLESGNFQSVICFGD